MNKNTRKIENGWGWEYDFINAENHSKIKEKATRLENKKKAATRPNTSGLFNKEIMSEYCSAMDNHFNLPKVIVVLRNMGVGIVELSGIVNHGLQRN